MRKFILDTPDALGRRAAETAAAYLNAAIRQKGRARLLMATGASQFETIHYLRKENVDWKRVELFHLDEYIGIGPDHPASFARYLRERFVRDDIPLAAAYYFDGLRDPRDSVAEMTARLNEAPVDAALVGIGENAHIAFNDPPADFKTQAAFIVVDLDEACKRQQVRESWYDHIDAVPKQAVTMTVRRIMESGAVISAVPHREKAEAVRLTLETAPDPRVPASVLQTHPDWTLYLDRASASKLSTANG